MCRVPDGQLLRFLRSDHPAAFLGGQEGDVEQVEGRLLLIARLFGSDIAITYFN